MGNIGKLLPDKAKAWVGAVVSLLVLVAWAMSNWGGMSNDFVLWSGRVFGLLVVLSNWLELKLPDFKRGVK